MIYTRKGFIIFAVALCWILMTLNQFREHPFELFTYHSSNSSSSFATLQSTVNYRNSTITSEGKSNVIRFGSAIFNIDTDTDTSSKLLECPRTILSRYDYLRKSSPKIEYFFALNIYEAAPILPRLLGTIIRTIEYLGPENCVLSIVEGYSTDGTYEILIDIASKLETLNIQYFFQTSDVRPVKEDLNRIVDLAELRNEALKPLTSNPNLYSSETSIIFLNDIALCPEDILELIHQKAFQKADMACGMDWIYGGVLFYDVFVSRSMNGDTFFEIPQNGSWDFAGTLFWSDPKTRKRFEHLKPFQVFSCWNGVTVFTAKPLLQHDVSFRASGKMNTPASEDLECWIGEPANLAKDFWRLGFGKIMVVPSVNVAYNDGETRLAKDRRGWTSESIEKAAAVTEVSEEINWVLKPPSLVKCFAHLGYIEPYWVDSITGYMV